jgi:hypothetical protein
MSGGTMKLLNIVLNAGQLLAGSKVRKLKWERML